MIPRLTSDRVVVRFDCCNYKIFKTEVEARPSIVLGPEKVKASVRVREKG